MLQDGTDPVAKLLPGAGGSKNSRAAKMPYLIVYLVFFELIS